MFKPMLSRKFAFKLRQGPSIFHRGWSKPPVEMHLKETCKSARKSTASVGQQIRRRRRSTSKDLWSSEGSARPGHLGSEPKPNIGHAVYAVPRRTAALAALAWPLSPTLLGFRGPDTRPSTTGLYFEPANKPRAGASGLGKAHSTAMHSPGRPEHVKEVDLRPRPGGSELSSPLGPWDPGALTHVPPWG